MHFLAVLKSVLVLLNMCNILELSGLFVYHGDLLRFSMPGWDRKKMLGCGLLDVSITSLIQWFFTNYSFQFGFFFYKLKFDTDGALLKAYFEMPSLEFTLYL